MTFFAELDRRGDPGRFDRTKATVIMDLLRRQLLSPRYIQHSARVLFAVGPATERERREILDAVFELSRETIVEQVRAGALGPGALAAHDYVHDIVDGPGGEPGPDARPARLASARSSR
jgi:malate synthase